VSGPPRTAKLVEIAELNPRLAESLDSEEMVSFVPMSAVTAESASTSTGEDRPYAAVSKGYTSFLNGDVLLAKITPCFENGKIAQANLSHRVGFGSTEFHVVRPLAGKADARYLMHFLRQEHIRRDGERKMTGSAGQRRVPAHFLASLEVPAPTLEEQRRIAEVLDRTEALRAKRRAGLAQLDTLTQSIFLDLFGDPATNPNGWEMLRLQDVLSMPLRNGLSPSHVGKITAKVLTLSAITGSEFDDTAWKVSTFRSPPPSDQSVDENDFLICRGNGNVRLVGKGYFPMRRMQDVTFPDTMIAARVRTERLERVFLQHIWGWNAVRRQIESLARTTNGTFKVNQTMLEGITFIGPPIQLQGEFARRVGAVDKLKVAQRTSLAELDALFAVLQHRAFRGEL
jgi:type I restriction enzyme, S subunit